VRLLALLLAAIPLSAATLTLNQALDEAAELSPDVQFAKLRTTEAETQVTQAKSGLRPQVAFQISGTYQTSNLQGLGLIFPGFPSRVGPYRTFDMRPVVTQTILDFPLRETIKAARLRAGEASTQADAVREDLLVQVATTYFAALETEARVKAAEARLATAEAILRQARDREATAIGSRLDIARAEQQMETERGLALGSQLEEDKLKSQLLNLIGRDQATVELTAPAEIPDSGAEADLVSEAKLKRPGLRVLHQEVSALQIDAEVARRERWPRLSAFGDWGVAGTGPDRSLSTYAIGASLTVPVWTGGRIEAGEALASVHASEVTKQIRKFELAIAQQVREAWLERESERVQLEAATRARDAADQALELSRVRLETGLATTVEVQVAQSNLAAADDTLIRTRFAVSEATTRLAWAAGDVRRAFR